MNIEDFKQLTKEEVPHYEQRLHQYASSEEVKQVMEKVLNKRLQQYLSDVPKEKFTEFVSAVYNMGEEDYKELEYLFSMKLDYSFYPYQPVEIGIPNIDEAILTDLVNNTSDLVFKKLLVGVTYEEFISSMMEKYISVAMKANQRLLTEYEKYILNISDSVQPVTLPDIRIINSGEEVHFSFEGISQKEREPEEKLPHYILSPNRKCLYGVLLYVQIAGIELPKGTELLKRLDIGKYSNRIFKRIQSYEKNFIKLLSQLIKEVDTTLELRETILDKHEDTINEMDKLYHSIIEKSEKLPRIVTLKLPEVAYDLMPLLEKELEGTEEELKVGWEQFQSFADAELSYFKEWLTNHPNAELKPHGIAPYAEKFSYTFSLPRWDVRELFRTITGGYLEGFYNLLSTQVSVLLETDTLEKFVEHNDPIKKILAYDKEEYFADLEIKLEELLRDLKEIDEFISDALIINDYIETFKESACEKFLRYLELEDYLYLVDEIKRKNTD